MRTVKEIAEITGISIRTLHYYDEIGLLKPTNKSEAGYRLYDDKALETLQQILFFREFDISLKKIKVIMRESNLDKNQLLQMQRKMLVTKKERMERLITSIDDILKGENPMNFKVFNKSEMEDIYRSMDANMTTEQKTIFIEQYGSMETFHKYFMENTSSEVAQNNLQNVLAWYGDKESMLEAAKNPVNTENLPVCQKQLETIMKKLAKKKGYDIHSSEVKKLIGEYALVSKQLYQMKDVSKILLELSTLYQTNSEIQKEQDCIYGNGTTEFLGKAIEAFYRHDSISD